MKDEARENLIDDLNSFVPYDMAVLLADKLIDLGYIHKSSIPELKLLSDEELVRITECESPEYLENEGADCQYCSNHCRQIAQAQLDSIKKQIEEGK